jgi:hypothetical protein
MFFNVAISDKPHLVRGHLKKIQFTLSNLLATP